MATITTTSGLGGTSGPSSITVMEATATEGGLVRPTSSRKLIPSHTFAVVDAESDSEDGGAVRQPAQQSLWATTLLITTLCGVTFASSMTTGLLAVALPTMAKELDISDGLLLW